jgi:uncharacterized ion transporter superfamily protein YfcC
MVIAGKVIVDVWLLITLVMTVMTVLAHLMEVPGKVIVDAYQETTQVMTVMTAQACLMVIM